MKVMCQKTAQYRRSQLCDMCNAISDDETRVWLYQVTEVIAPVASRIVLRPFVKNNLHIILSGAFSRPDECS